jgi:HEAT repeat protein
MIRNARLKSAARSCNRFPRFKGTRVEDKLFAVAKADENVDLRRQAIRLLGERAGKRSLDFLSATAQSNDGNAEVQMQAVRAISERNAEEAVPLLIKIARNPCEPTSPKTSDTSSRRIR